MHWEDSAIVVAVRKFSERDAMVTVFSREHGSYRAIAKGAYASAQRGIYQQGNIVQAGWNARLQEHMGNLKAELSVPIAACVLTDPPALTALQSICGMLERLLHERDPHPQLYDAARSALLALARAGDWQESYVNFELALLAGLGFGLDLERCAATGSREDLIYVSPKSGRAVSREAGEQYREKMLPLPAFMRERGLRAGLTEIAEGLKLTGFFLQEWLLSPHGWQMPASRERLLESLAKVPEPLPA